MRLDWDDLPACFPGFQSSGRWLPLLQQHAQLVADARHHVRLSAVAPEDIIRRQYGESLEVLRLIEAAQPVATTLADVGSGGGFPGLVIAALRPDLAVHLVEPLRKRAAQLEAMATEMGLRNVTVHAQRAEEAGRGALRDAADVVTARAVAALRELLEYTAPLAREGGVLVLPKGSGFEAELAEAGNALTALSCRFEAFAPMRPEVSATPGAAIVRKVAPTSALHPRRPGIPAKRPL